MHNTQQELDEAFNGLPEEVQDFIMSEEIADSTHIIAEGYEITGEKYDAFAMDIFTLLVGLGSTDKFKEDLKGKMGIEEDMLNNVLVEVSGLILEPCQYVFQK